MTAHLPGAGTLDHPAQPMSVADAALFLDDGVAFALGIGIVRTPRLPRGTILSTRDRSGYVDRIYIGTDSTLDPLEAVRRDARRWVREGMTRARVVPRDLAYRHLKEREAEDQLDAVTGAPEWPR